MEEGLRILFRATSCDSLNKRMRLKQMSLGLIKQPPNVTVLRLLCSITSSNPELEGSGCSVDTHPSNAQCLHIQPSSFFCTAYSQSSHAVLEDAPLACSRVTAKTCSKHLNVHSSFMKSFEGTCLVQCRYWEAVTARSLTSSAPQFCKTAARVGKVRSSSKKKTAKSLIETFSTKFSARVGEGWRPGQCEHPEFIFLGLQSFR